MTAPTPPPPGQAVQPRNGLGTTGFVLGLLATLFSLIPIIGVIAWPLAILGLIFGILGILRARKGAATNKGLAIAGTVLAAIGLVICIIWTALAGAAVEGANRELNRIEKELEQAAPPVQDGEQASEPTKLAFGKAHVWPGGEGVVVSAPTKYTENNPLILNNDERGVAVDITITNKTGDEINPASWDITATHGDRPAEMLMTEDAFANAQVPSGGELTITRAFKVGPEPAELQISVAPNMFAESTVYYHGEF
ncbi:hypothetical protein DFQ14_107216 [Halopolyspora algeriensis]|uniref:DUF4352 domain-containing protein n=1 Tax=Halopolyspora algeriensis TaxID=1500506 RepID=A0A368VTL5_9ACTN|nr:DUF4190 domain-containing protein [Halopolyspora algeriensis]RCW43326.1 hypothetical protein DFQ14_107216 [Halopolyspora algeriensis]TQM56383.1 hypothetical protein FHU43_1179 [Halopolyspora algeriensis]